MKIQGTSSEIAEAVFAVIDMERNREDIPLTDSPINLVADTRAIHREVEYKRQLAEWRSVVSGLHHQISDYMSENLEDDASDDFWQESYALMQNLGAMLTTLAQFQKNTYPPF